MGGVLPIYAARIRPRCCRYGSPVIHRTYQRPYGSDTALRESHRQQSLYAECRVHRRLLLRKGIPILALAKIYPTCWLVLRVTLAGLIIGVSLVGAASKRYVLTTRSRRIKMLALFAAIVLYSGDTLVLIFY